MASNYKKLGEYISEVDKRNSDLSLGENDLFGISVSKEFITTHANLVGVSFDNYKVVNNRNFAYISDTSRRGDKIAISLNDKDKNIIVSSICTVFQINDETKLLPEYLILWFMRPEFDRYARFMSNGSAREIFDWECMCGVELPVPSIEEQRKIVHDYKVITDRIELLKKIKRNFYCQSEAIFRNISSEELIAISSLSGVREISSGITKFNNNKKYYATGDIDYDYKMDTYEIVSYIDRPSRANMQPIINSLWFAKMQNTNKFLFFNELSKDLNELILSTGFMGIECKENIFYYLLAFIFTKKFNEQKDRFATGTTQVAINSDALNKIMIPIPLENKGKEYKLLKKYFCNIQLINDELSVLFKLKELQLSVLSRLEVA